jgi:hypothetical protein
MCECVARAPSAAAFDFDPDITLAKAGLSWGLPVVEDRLYR